jgi:hypothetical protein
VSGFILEGRKAGLFTIVKRGKNVFLTFSFGPLALTMDWTTLARHTLVRKCSVAASSAMADAPLRGPMHGYCHAAKDVVQCAATLSLSVKSYTVS